MEAICLKIEGCWEVVTSGKGGRGCGSPGSGKGLVGGLKGVVVEAICLRLKGVVKWLQVERLSSRTKFDPPPLFLHSLQFTSCKFPQAAVWQVLYI